MITSKLKLKIINHEIIIGTMLSEIYTPNIVRMLASSGFDYIFVDCEHGYFDFSQIANIASIGKGFNLPIIVRVPSIQREFITKVLDIGVDGLLLPQVDNIQYAQDAVQYSKYTPIGKRGLSTTRSHTNYYVSSLADYIKNANDNLILLAQIESQSAIDNAKSIIAVDGIDGLIIGPNDMAADLGFPGQIFCDEIKHKINSVIEISQKYSKPIGIVDSNMKHLEYWKQCGMSIFCAGSEIHMLIKSAKDTIKAFESFL